MHLQAPHTPARAVECFLYHCEPFRCLKPGLHFCRVRSTGKTHHWATRHPICKDSAAGTPTELCRMLQKHTLMLKTHALIPIGVPDCPQSPPIAWPRVIPKTGNYKKCQRTPIALQPLLVLATRQPSVVAIGT